MSTRIGLDKLHYAIMTTEDDSTTAPAYAIPVAADGVMVANINPNSSLDTLFADDGPYESAATLGNIEVEIQKAFLTPQNKADLLGHTLDSQGGVIFSDNDTPPYVAIGFRSLKANGKYKYTWLQKGRFSEPEDNNETKGDTINWQQDTINGQFVKLTFPIVVNGDAKRVWKYEIDEDGDKVDADVIAAWFDKVQLPPADAATP